MMSLSMEDELVSVLASMPNGLNSSRGRAIVYHVSQGDCFCETLSESHKKTLNEWAFDKQISYQTLALNSIPALSRFVPSTPAVIVLNQQNELVYLGPYSTGMGCLQDSGLVDERIKSYFQNTNRPLTATIQSEAKGCYCATQPVHENA